MDISVIHNLAEQLDGHLERYQSLIDFLDQERKCLLAIDLEGLLATSQLKEKLARSIHESIHQLTSSLVETALMLGIPTAPPPTLTEVAAKCPRPYDNRLAEGAMCLVRLKNVISRENESNRRFVEQSLSLVNESLNVLTGADQYKAEGYRKDGSKDKSVKKARPAKLSKEV